MRLTFRKNATSGMIPIPAGEYWISLSHESGEIKLTAGGKDIRIKATRRRVQARTRVLNIQLVSGGGRIWSLVISTPKHGEWVAFIEYE